MIIRWDDVFAMYTDFDPDIEGEPIFLDLGLFDIPETIECAVRAILTHPRIIAVSITDLPPMMEAAKRAAEGTALRIIPRPFID